MYTYEFERVRMEQSVFRLEMAFHQKMITRRAEEGWRYVGYIPAVQNTHGVVFEMDLIFEKER